MGRSFRPADVAGPAASWPRRVWAAAGGLDIPGPRPGGPIRLASRDPFLRIRPEFFKELRPGGIFGFLSIATEQPGIHAWSGVQPLTSSSHASHTIMGGRKLLRFFRLPQKDLGSKRMTGRARTNYLGIPGISFGPGHVHASVPGCRLLRRPVCGAELGRTRPDAIVKQTPLRDWSSQLFARDRRGPSRAARAQWATPARPPDDVPLRERSSSRIRRQEQGGH